MRRTSLWLLLALSTPLAGWACSDGPTHKRQAAPNQGVLPSAGKSGDGAGSDSQEPPDSQAGDSGMVEAGTGGAPDAAGSGGATDVDTAGAPTGGNTVGTEVRFRVAPDSPTFVNLASASVVDVTDEERGTSAEWDLVFQGWDIFTNGGASGGGKGAAFGPLPFTYFWAATEPTDVPFLIEDKAAGAFRDWYFYDGQWHTLYSRFHVYGVKSGQRLFKLQVLGYYGDVQGAPISALYHLRYAEVTADGSGNVVEIQKLDGTAGGLGGDDKATNGCLTLKSGEQQQLTPAQAAASSIWDLSFRRDSISINGGLGGPGGVLAVDFDADSTASETLDGVKKLTAESEAARLAAVDFAALTAPALKYRGDRIVSAFTEAWIDTSVAPPQLPSDDTWLVVTADGKSRFLLGFTALKDSTSDAAGTVVLRIVKVR